MTHRWITPAITDAGVRRHAARLTGAIRPAELAEEIRAAFYART